MYLNCNQTDAHTPRRTVVSERPDDQTREIDTHGRQWERETEKKRYLTAARERHKALVLREAVAVLHTRTTHTWVRIGMEPQRTSKTCAGRRIVAIRQRKRQRAARTPPFRLLPTVAISFGMDSLRWRRVGITERVDRRENQESRSHGYQQQRAEARTENGAAAVSASQCASSGTCARKTPLAELHSRRPVSSKRCTMSSYDNSCSMLFIPSFHSSAASPPKHHRDPRSRASESGTPSLKS